MDWAWIEAAKEVDAIAPNAPPLYVEPKPQSSGNLIPHPCYRLPRGWRYNEFMDRYFGPNDQQVEGMAVAMSGDPLKFWADRAADLSDVLEMARPL